MSALTGEEQAFLALYRGRTFRDAGAMQRVIAITDRLAARVAELERERDTPESVDFLLGVQVEISHQRERWKATDPVKTAADWFWLVGYLASKALHASMHGDHEKALHHTVTAAAALANWHAAMKEAIGGP